MDRDEALDMMGLKEDATKAQVSQRYSVLVLKYKNITTDNNGHTFNDVTKAYNILMGYDFHDPEAEKRKQQILDNPPFWAKILKVDPLKTQNFFHYHKIHILVSILLVVFLFMIIRSCMNIIPVDFGVAFVGDVYVEDAEIIQNIINDEFEGINKSEAMVFSTFAYSDPTIQSTLQMKLIAEIHAGKIDIFVMTYNDFLGFAEDGVLKPLNATDYSFNEEAYLKAKHITTDIDGNITSENEDIYGIEVTGMPFFEQNNVLGNRLIIGKSITSKNIENAEAFINMLSRQTKNAD